MITTGLAGRCWTALLAVALCAWIIGFTASPAAAEPLVSVTTPAGDRYSPGEPLPLLVEITANGAIDGTISVWVQGIETVTQRFDVAGGATKTIIVITDTLRWGADLVVDVRTSDGDVSLRPRLIDDPEAELVGVLPSLQQRGLPATTRTITGDRNARLYELTEQLLLAGPPALRMFDSMVGSNDDFDQLPASAQESLRSWTAGGGDLILDDAVGSAVPDLGLEAGGMVTESYGFGTVRFTDGQLRRGSADGVIGTTSKIREVEFGRNVDPSISGRLLIRDAGIEIPGIGALLLLVGAYILVVGPVLFLVLRRSNRQPLAWAAIPAVAAVAVAAVWGVGRAQRSDVDLAHASVIAHVNGVHMEESEVLIASANGGYVGIDMSDGFSATNRSFNEFGEQIIRPVESREGSMGLRLNPGEASRLTVERVGDPRTAPEASFGIDVDVEDRRLAGTVTNTSGWDLVDVQVAAGNAVVNIGALADGAIAEVDLDAQFAYVPITNDRLFETMRQDQFPFGGQDDLAVNAGAFSTWVNRHLGSRSAGQVLAVGWTREPAAPVKTDRGLPITRGRTAFVTIEAIADNATPDVRYGEATAALQRLWDFELNDTVAQGFVEVPTEVLLTLPPSAAPDGTYVLEIPGDVAAIDLWTGSSWDPIGDEVDRASGILVLPAEAVIDGRVHVRIGFSQFGRSPMPVLRAAAANEATAAPPATDTGGVAA